MIFGAHVLYRYLGQEDQRERIYTKEVVFCVEADDLDSAVDQANKIAERHVEVLNKDLDYKLWEYIGARKVGGSFDTEADNIPDGIEVSYSKIHFYKSSDRHNFLNKKEVKLPYFY